LIILSKHYGSHCDAMQFAPGARIIVVSRQFEPPRKITPEDTA
jgi:hypothetical protein